MSPFHRRRRAEADVPPELEAVAPRRPHAGLLRRERRALLKAREERLRDLGGLLVEMYRRGSFRDDLLAEGCADVVGIDARLAEIEELLHARRAGARRCECGAPILRGSHFCPNCGRPLGEAAGNGASEETVIEPAGAVVAIAVTTRQRENTGSTFVAPPAQSSVAEPTTPTARPTTANTATLPT